MRGSNHSRQGQQQQQQPAQAVASFFNAAAESLQQFLGIPLTTQEDRSDGGDDTRPSSSSTSSRQRRTSRTASMPSSSTQPQQQQQQQQPQSIPPASLRVVRQLPAVMMQPDDLIDPVNRQCSICLDDLHVHDCVLRLPCAHLYHPACIREWLLERHCTCPVCRYELPTDVPAFEIGRIERMRHRKPRFALHTLQHSMSIRELKQLLRSSPHAHYRNYQAVDKADLIRTVMESDSIEVIVSAVPPVSYQWSTLQGMTIRQLKQCMQEDVGVFYDPTQVVEKSDLLRIFLMSGRLTLLPDDDAEDDDDSPETVMDDLQCPVVPDNDNHPNANGFHSSSTMSIDVAEDDMQTQAANSHKQRHQQQQQRRSLAMMASKNPMILVETVTEDWHGISNGFASTTASAASNLAWYDQRSDPDCLMEENLDFTPPPPPPQQQQQQHDTDRAHGPRYVDDVAPSVERATMSGGRITISASAMRPVFAAVPYTLIATAPSRPVYAGEAYETTNDRHDGSPNDNERNSALSTSDAVSDPESNAIANDSVPDRSPWPQQDNDDDDSDDSDNDSPARTDLEGHHDQDWHSGEQAGAIRFHEPLQLFQNCSISQLKGLARVLRVDVSGCLERKDMMERLTMAQSDSSSSGSSSLASSSQLAGWAFLQDCAISELRVLADILHVDLPSSSSLLSSSTSSSHHHSSNHHDSYGIGHEDMLIAIQLAAVHDPELAAVLMSVVPLVRLSTSQLRAVAREWHVPIAAHSLLEKGDLLRALMQAIIPT